MSLQNINNICSSFLIKYFQTINNYEKEIESIRNEICSLKTFNPLNLFYLIDKEQKNFITMSDLKSYFDKKNISYSDLSLRKFIHHFDKDSDFNINYNEFNYILTPKKNVHLKEKINNTNYDFDTNSNIDEIENLFDNIIQKEMELIKELFEILNELKLNENFTIYEMFLCVLNQLDENNNYNNNNNNINNNNNKYIYDKDIKNFLEKYGVVIGIEDAQNIIYRMDNNNDGKISYEEFREIFFPYRLNYPFNLVSNKKIGNLKLEDFNKYNFNYDTENKNIKNDNINLNNNNYNNNNFNNLKNNKIKNNVIYKKSFPIMPTTSFDYKTGTLLDKGINYKPIRKRNINNENNFSTYNIDKTNYSINSIENNKTNISLKNNFTFNNNCNDYISSLNTQQSYNNNKSNFNTNINDNICNNNNKYFQSVEYSQTYPFSKINKCDNIDNNINYFPKIICSHNNNNSYCCNCNCKYKSKKLILFNLLSEIIRQENLIESKKIKLSLCSDVTLKNLFRFFDYSNLYSISRSDLLKVLNELNCQITLDDTKFIFKRFDKNLDSRLDFNEFVDMILPRTYEYKRILNERTSDSFFVGFSLESKEIIRELFKCLINAGNSIEYFRIMLNRESENLLEIYNMLRKEYKQGVYLEDIIEFLCENGLRKNLNNVDILFEYLDKKKDGIISFDEFAELICPMI